MKNLNLIYKHGHFYDSATRKRIHLKDGAEFVFVGNSNSFLEIDPLNPPHDRKGIRDTPTMEKAVSSIKNLEWYAKILPARTKLRFRIGISKPKTENEDRFYDFELILLEDLYIYSKTDWKKSTLPALYDCSCEVYANPSHNIDFFEPVYGKSLSDIYGKTCVFFLQTSELLVAMLSTNLK